MKKLKLLSILPAVVATIFGRKKQTMSLKNPSNIPLWNQRSNTIKKHIQDKWKIIYTDGGLVYFIKCFDVFYAEQSTFIKTFFRKDLSFPERKHRKTTCNLHIISSMGWQPVQILDTMK